MWGLCKRLIPKSWSGLPARAACCFHMTFLLSRRLRISVWVMASRCLVYSSFLIECQLARRLTSSCFSPWRLSPANGRIKFFFCPCSRFGGSRPGRADYAADRVQQQVGVDGFVDEADGAE